MTISDLIKQLEELKEFHGECVVRMYHRGLEYPIKLSLYEHWTITEENECTFGFKTSADVGRYIDTLGIVEIDRFVKAVLIRGE